MSASVIMLKHDVLVDRREGWGVWGVGGVEEEDEPVIYKCLTTVTEERGDSRENVEVKKEDSFGEKSVCLGWGGGGSHREADTSARLEVGERGESWRLRGGKAVIGLVWCLCNREV